MELFAYNVCQKHIKDLNFQHVLILDYHFFVGVHFSSHILTFIGTKLNLRSTSIGLWTMVK